MPKRSKATKSERREKKKRPRMSVSGRSVFTLARIRSRHVQKSRGKI